MCDILVLKYQQTAGAVTRLQPSHCLPATRLLWIPAWTSISWSMPAHLPGADVIRLTCRWFYFWVRKNTHSRQTRAAPQSRLDASALLPVALSEIWDLTQQIEEREQRFSGRERRHQNKKMLFSCLWHPRPLISKETLHRCTQGVAPQLH